MALAKGFSTIEAAAEAAVRPIVEGHGFSLWDVWFAKEGAKSVSYTHLTLPTSDLV